MLFLASKSPRRRQLLEQLGYRFGVLDVDIPEVPTAGEAALDYSRRVARGKAGAGLMQAVATPNAVVLAADTEVVLDGAIFGKPEDDAHALDMLRRLSGRTHEVVTAVYVVDAGREAEAVSVSEVTFATLGEAEIRAYVASGEPRGKAGAYAIQGRAAAYVARLAGSYSGVVGLPLHDTSRLLAEFGIRL